MSVIRFSCGQCGAALAAKPEWAGRTARCKKCGQALKVPSPEEPVDHNSAGRNSTQHSSDAAENGQTIKPFTAAAEASQASVTTSAGWYYTRDGSRCGPVPRQQLERLFESREIGDDELVWTQGLSDWQPARLIPGLVPDAHEPPPLPSQVPSVSRGISRPSPSRAAAPPASPAFLAETPVGWLRAGLVDGSRSFFSIMGAMIVAWLIGAASGMVPIVGPLAVLGPLMCGVCAMLLAVARRQSDSFSHLFDGFKIWSQALVMSLLLMVYAIASLVVFVALGVGIGKLTGSVTIPILVLHPIFCYVSTRLFLYVPALVVDRGVEAGKAMAFNWRLTSGRKYHLFLLLMLPYTFLLFVVAYGIMSVLGLSMPGTGLLGVLVFILGWGLMLCLMGAVLFMPFVHAYNGRVRELDTSPRE